MPSPAQGGPPLGGETGGPRGAGRAAGGAPICQRRGGAARVAKGAWRGAARPHGAQLVKKIAGNAAGMHCGACRGCRGRCHSRKNPAAAAACKSGVAAKLAALAGKAGRRVKVGCMEEARCGWPTARRRVGTRRGLRPVGTRQSQDAGADLYGALDAVRAWARCAHRPGVRLEWDQSSRDNLVASAPGAIPGLGRDPAGCPRRAGDPR